MDGTVDVAGKSQRGVGGAFFFDTDVILDQATADPAEASRADELLAGGGPIRIQVLNEFFSLSMAMSPALVDNRGNVVDNSRTLSCRAADACGPRGCGRPDARSQVRILRRAHRGKCSQTRQTFHAGHAARPCNRSGTHDRQCVAPQISSSDCRRGSSRSSRCGWRRCGSGRRARVGSARRAAGSGPTCRRPARATDRLR